MPSSASRKPRQRRRAPLPLPAGAPSPVLALARAPGVETAAWRAAQAAGLGVTGHVPSGTRHGEGFEACPGTHPGQALKWTIRAAPALLVLATERQPGGRAGQALKIARRYRKRALVLTPADDLDAMLGVWWTTRPLPLMALSGPEGAIDAPLLGLVERVIAWLAAHPHQPSRRELRPWSAGRGRAAARRRRG
jgi:hypothetical protein